jgi:hypothetical protein
MPPPLFAEEISTGIIPNGSIFACCFRLSLNIQFSGGLVLAGFLHVPFIPVIQHEEVNPDICQNYLNQKILWSIKTDNYSGL